MLNPSTADETRLDPTVRRCVGYAMRWGYGGLVVGNIFAFRSTDPAGLRAAEDPVGPGNDAALVEMASRWGMVVCAWGGHGKFMGRGREVAKSVASEARELCALRLTASGDPGHPLYLPGNLLPTWFGYGR